MDIASTLGAHVRFQGDIWTHGFRDFAASSLETALGRFKRRITGVTVALEDLNGPRGGVDKRCRIVLGLRRDRTVVVQATAENEYAAIAEACSRVRSRVVRTLTSDRRRRRPGRTGVSLNA
jgi:hypothetical protein